MIRDKIVFSVPKIMNEKLLRDTDLTLKSSRQATYKKCNMKQ